MVKARGKRMMMWGDMLLNYKSAADRLPKDITIFDWRYEESSASTVEFFHRKNFEVFVCPAMSGFGRIAAPYQLATNNIYTFIGQGAQAGAVGECTCAWEFRVGHLFENDYFGIMLSGERAWNLGTNIDDFNRRFCKSFFGIDDTRPIELYRDISDGFREICEGYIRDRSYTRRNASLAWDDIDTVVKDVGQDVSYELLDKVTKQRDRTLELLTAVRGDCSRNRQATDFLDMPANTWVYAIKRILFYRQALELMEAAKTADAASAGKNLAKAESLLDRIEAELPYFEGRFREAVTRFGGSEVDIQRVDDMRKRLQKRKLEIAEMRRQVLP
jgi:hypothetical protein